MYLRYWLYYLPALLVSILCWFTNPIACLFPSRQANGRDKLWGIFNLWSTHDAPVDEFWYFGYDTDLVDKTTYENSWWWRYWYRLRWLKRNTGYGWSYLLFSIPHGTGFQWKGQSKPFLGYVNDFNVGWKLHTGFKRDDYAARIIGLRKVANHA